LIDRPVQFELTEQTRASVQNPLKVLSARNGRYFVPRRAKIGRDAQLKAPGAATPDEAATASDRLLLRVGAKLGSVMGAARPCNPETNDALRGRRKASSMAIARPTASMADPVDLRKHQIPNALQADHLS
jgi:hypothetical protein